MAINWKNEADNITDTALLFEGSEDIFGNDSSSPNEDNNLDNEQTRYVFNESGHYVRTEKNKDTHKFVIENSKTKAKIEVYFNNPKSDIENIQFFLKRDGEQKFKGKQFVNWVSDEDIKKMMKGAGIEKKEYPTVFTAKESSHNGFMGEQRMDFAANRWGLLRFLDDRTLLMCGEQCKTFPFVKDIAGYAKNAHKFFNIYELYENGPMYIMGTKYQIAYNHMEAGNWLWGYSTKIVGLTYDQAKTLSLTYNYKDEPEDQRAVREVFFYPH